jgi:hypothetical protein
MKYSFDIINLVIFIFVRELNENLYNIELFIGLYHIVICYAYLPG